MISSNSPIKNLDDAQKALTVLQRNLAPANPKKAGPASVALAQLILEQANLEETAVKNVSLGESKLAVQDAAIASISDVAIQVQELTVQAANGTLTDQQRGSITAQITALTQSAADIAGAQFNGSSVFTSTTLQVGTDGSTSSQLTLPGSDVSSALSALQSLNTTSQLSAQAGIESLTAISGLLAGQRAELGAAASRIMSTVESLRSSSVAKTEAAGKITDPDIAEVTANRTADLIRQQTGTAVLAQVNSVNKTMTAALIG